MSNLNKNVIMTNFNNYKFLLQKLINKINVLSNKIEILEKKEDNNINEDIISIFATYENKIELLENRVEVLENLLNQNEIEYTIDNNLNC